MFMHYLLLKFMIVCFSWSEFSPITFQKREQSFLFLRRISSQQLIKQLQYENDALQSKIISVEQSELQEVSENKNNYNNVTNRREHQVGTETNRGKDSERRAKLTDKSYGENHTRYLCFRSLIRLS